MRTTLARRLGASVAAGALALGTLAAAPAPASAVTSYASSAARWLSDQVQDGTIVNAQWGSADHGLALDVFFALHELDVRSATRTAILDRLASDPAAYVTGGEYGPDDRYAGATGKLASAVQAGGRDPRAFGGWDLVATAEQRVQATGRATDESAYGDYSNTIGQSWVVRALATADSDLADETTEYLLRQQCADGSFRSAMADTACGRGAGTVDATAFAVQALQVARDAGVPGVADDLAEGLDWLAGQQAADGSFTVDGGANANSTGLAGTTLARAGRPGPAGNAAAWLVAQQVTDAVAEDSRLTQELGAIAFDRAALSAGLADGITDATRDQWIRATAQAAVALDAQLSRATLPVAVPSGYRQGGTSATVRASGLVAGENVTFLLDGKVVARRTASASGVASAAVRLPAATRTSRVTVRGARTVRTGTASVTVLGARKLTVRLTRKVVSRGRNQRVTVTGLAAGERVRVYHRGRVVHTGKASAKGTYTRAFAVGRARGLATVKVVGQFGVRAGAVRHRVR